MKSLSTEMDCPLKVRSLRVNVSQPLVNLLSFPPCFGGIYICYIMCIICLYITGNPEGLGVELLETLVKMAPTKEEEIKLRDYQGDVSKLGTAERFLKAVLDIPFAFKRVEAMLYRANFDTEVKYLRKSFQTLEVFWLKLKFLVFDLLNP